MQHAKQRFPTGQDDTGNTLMTSNASTDGEPRRFIGQEQVAEVNLVDLNRRMYDPWVGQFLSVDPVIDSVYNSQSLNPYAYVANNPLTFSDPSEACKGILGCTFDIALFGLPGLLRPLDSFTQHAFGNVELPILAIAAAATAQYYVLPELEGFTSFAAVAEASPGLAAADDPQGLKAFNSVVKALKLTPDQAQQRHWEITGQGLSRQEIMDEAKSLFGK